MYDCKKGVKQVIEVQVVLIEGSAQYCLEHSHRLPQTVSLKVCLQGNDLLNLCLDLFNAKDKTLESVLAATLIHSLNLVNLLLNRRLHLNNTFFSTLYFSLVSVLGSYEKS